MKYEITPEMVYQRPEAEVIRSANLQSNEYISDFRPPKAGERYIACSTAIIMSHGGIEDVRLIVSRRKGRKYVFTEVVPRPNLLRAGDYYTDNHAKTIYCYGGIECLSIGCTIFTREVIEE